MTKLTNAQRKRYTGATASCAPCVGAGGIYRYTTTYTGARAAAIARIT